MTEDREKSARLIMVTGGQRSGKSLFAENMALKLSATPTYLATARVLDDEMRRRVDIHRQRRGNMWKNLEASLSIENITFSPGDVVLLDCLTMWATNLLFEKEGNADEALSAIKHQFDILLKTEATFIMVTNEIGLGGISADALQRKFTDLQGHINQYVASLADEVYMVISGIPVKIKPRP